MPQLMTANWSDLNIFDSIITQFLEYVDEFFTWFADVGFKGNLTPCQDQQNKQKNSSDALHSIGHKFKCNAVNAVRC